MRDELVEAVSRWATHVASEPKVLLAEVAQLRRPTGTVDVDAHRALLADILQGVHTLIVERTP